MITPIDATKNQPFNDSAATPDSADADIKAAVIDIVATGSTPNG